MIPGIFPSCAFCAKPVLDGDDITEIRDAPYPFRSHSRCYKEVMGAGAEAIRENIDRTIIDDLSRMAKEGRNP